MMQSGLFLFGADARLHHSSEHVSMGTFDAKRPAHMHAVMIPTSLPQALA